MDHASGRARLPGEEDREEHNRIERVYSDYRSDPYYRKIWSSPAVQFLLDRKWEEIVATLAAEKVDLRAARLLDIGAGSGADCDRFCHVGMSRENIVATDLRDETVRSTRQRLNWLTILRADGARLPFRDGSFDVVYQSTMISSVLDRNRRLQILHEIQRVLTRDGLFLSYDTRYRNPWNHNTAPLSAAEIRAAFPGWRLSVKSTTPIPPLARLAGRVSRRLIRWIEVVPVLRSHFLAVARRS